MSITANNSDKAIGRKAILLIILLSLLAICGRLAVVTVRPMHADEATQTFIFADLLEFGSYVYDPAHHHGPAAHFLHLVILRPFGITSVEQLQEWQFRMQGVLLGGVCALLASLCVFHNKRAALFACMLAGSSPLLFYFNGMAIPETLLAVVSLAVPLLTAHTLKNKTDTFAAILIGLLLGILLATKETWSIIGLSWLIAILILYPRHILSVARHIGIAKLLIVTICGLLTAAILYTNFFQNPQAALDSLRTFFIYETDPGHNKAWHYYLTSLIAPRIGNASFTGEIILFSLGILSLFFSKRPHPSHPPSLATFLCVSSLLQLLIYSIIPYKTPWLLLVPILYLVPAAASLLAGIPRRGLAWGLALFLVAANLHQVIATSYLHPTAIENPYAYAPTLPEAEQTLKALNEELPREALIAVVGDDYWPIPWYLRQRQHTTGYYTSAPEHIESFDLILYAKDAFYSAPHDPPGRASTPFSLRSGTYVDAQLKIESR